MQKWRSLVKTAKHQIYISRTRDPFVNLSIEHFLLQTSAPESKILFLYINDKSVVIGRNQNPWLEANLRYLQQRDGQLVRRRSGGGTVFHDEGNVNYSVICPAVGFTRDKHAEMVTKAIRTFNDRVRVNERHDIVLDAGSSVDPSQLPPKSDLHRTKYKTGEGSLKVSGSAYKMIRNRCLHHGTCLVALPNQRAFYNFLNSPAHAYIKAKGVDSVPSKVGNVLNYIREDLKGSASEVIAYYTDRMEYRIMAEFATMYGLDPKPLIKEISKDSRLRLLGDRRGKKTFAPRKTQTPALSSGTGWAGGYIGEEALEIPEIAEGVGELKSPEWIYGQTPEFTLSSEAYREDNLTRPFNTTPPRLTDIYLKVRKGQVFETRLSTTPGQKSPIEQEFFDGALKGRNIHEIDNFLDTLSHQRLLNSSKVHSVMSWLNMMFAKKGGPAMKSLKAMKTLDLTTE